MPTNVPGFVSAGAKALTAFTIGAGAIALMDGLLGNNLTPVATNNYTINGLTKFPADLAQIDGQMYCILFQFYKYNRPSIMVAPTLIPYGSIALPLPADMIDNSAQSYSEEASSAAVSAALENIPSNVGSWAGVSQAVTAFLAGDAKAGINGISNLGTKLGDSQTTARILQFGGVAQNPFLSVLYNSPTFKRHVFSWTLIPETADDTEKLNYILNKFRYHSMPDVNNTIGGLLLNYPDMCIPTITPAGYMYDFKQCVIEGMSINYAPGDSPAFNTSQAPNAIKLTIKLLEIEYWVKSSLLNTTSGPSAGNIGPYGSAA
jgi:hypothetical protein